MYDKIWKHLSYFFLFHSGMRKSLWLCRHNYANSIAWLQQGLLMSAGVKFRPEASFTSEVRSDLNVDSWKGDVWKSNWVINVSNTAGIKSCWIAWRLTEGFKHFHLQKNILKLRLSSMR